MPSLNLMHLGRSGPDARSGSKSLYTVVVVDLKAS
jgi:hypothetical protein